MYNIYYNTNDERCGISPSVKMQAAAILRPERSHFIIFMCTCIKVHLRTVQKPPQLMEMCVHVYRDDLLRLIKRPKR